MMRRTAILLPLLLLGCGPSATDPAAGGVSAGEAKALNEAAAALEDNGADAVIETNDAAATENAR